MRSPLVTFAFALTLMSLGTTAALAAERPLSTDRPDRTESPFTVPRGRLQLEMDLASRAHDRLPTENDGGTISGGSKIDALDVAPFNFKIGVTDRADIQFLMAPWSETRITYLDGGRFDDEGAGDVTGRVKLNVMGNDEGRLAVA